MTRSTALARALAALAALAATVALAACASTAAVDVASPSIARADEPDATVPTVPRPFEGPGADAARAARGPPTSTALNDRELARIDALLACTTDPTVSCAAAPHPLASAAWLVGRIDAKIVAVIARTAPGVEDDVRALGLAGVVVEEDT